MFANSNAIVPEQYTEIAEPVNVNSQAISDDVMIYLHIYVNTVTGMIISLTGVSTNFLNIIVFLKLGLKDSMSVGLFFLAVTDFLITNIQLASCTCYVVSLLCPENSAYVKFLGYYLLGWALCVLYEISSWITAMVSLERCYCVVSPFKVKQVFTRQRCIVATSITYFIYIVIHIPIYLDDSVDSAEMPTLFGNNTTTQLALEGTLPASDDHSVRLVDFIMDLLAGFCAWLCSQAVIIVCAVWMGYSLEASSKVRQHSSYESQSSTGTRLVVPSKDASTLSNRERRLVKVVLFLAIAMTCCNIPKMITTTIYYSFPGTNNGKQENLSTVLWSLAYMSVSMGCSFSFVVYINLNANYKRALNNIFTRNSQL